MTETQYALIEKDFTPIVRTIPPRVGPNGKQRRDSAEYCLSTLLAEAKRSGHSDNTLVFVSIYVSDRGDYARLSSLITRLRVERNYRREFQSRAKLIHFDGRSKNILAVLNTTDT